MTRIRRALLFMPGDDRRKIEKGAASSVDSVIMDLEDGVAFSAKAAARATIASALKEVDFGRTEKLVRMTAVSRDNFPEDDIEQTVVGKPDGYLIPKVEHSWQVALVSERLTSIERRQGWDEGSIVLIPIVETAMGVVNVREIAENSPRLVALAFGAEDLAGSLGAIRTPAMTEAMYARAAVVLHAKAYGLQAIDTPYANLTDTDGLFAETTQALIMGYTGKQAVHPKQIDIIQAVFTPTDEQILAALRIIRAHEEHQEKGEGVFALDGKMVDMPVVRAAAVVIARARAAGIDV
jgi:citrate lyase beta subunit